MVSGSSTSVKDKKLLGRTRTRGQKQSKQIESSDDQKIMQKATLSIKEPAKKRQKT
jgi:hypothetical protein